MKKEFSFKIKADFEDILSYNNFVLIFFQKNFSVYMVFISFVMLLFLLTGYVLLFFVFLLFWAIVFPVYYILYKRELEASFEAAKTPAFDFVIKNKEINYSVKKGKSKEVFSLKYEEIIEIARTEKYFFFIISDEQFIPLKVSEIEEVEKLEKIIITKPNFKDYRGLLNKLKAII
jgi:hypothetical protein